MKIIIFLSENFHFFGVKFSVYLNRHVFVMQMSKYNKTETEPGHSISYKIAYAPSEDSDQPMHPRSLIRIIAGHYG